MMRTVFRVTALALGMVLTAFLIVADPMMIKYPTKVGMLAFIAVAYVGGELLLSVGIVWLARAFAAIRSWLGWLFRIVACRLRGHDLEPEITKLKVVQLPSAPPSGPPTSAYRLSAEDMEPSLGLIIRRGRRCRRCGNDLVSPDNQP